MRHTYDFNPVTFAMLDGAAQAIDQVDHLTKMPIDDQGRRLSDQPGWYPELGIALYFKGERRILAVQPETLVPRLYGPIISVGIPGALSAAMRHLGATLRANPHFLGPVERPPCSGAWLAVEAPTDAVAV